MKKKTQNQHFFTIFTLIAMGHHTPPLPPFFSIPYSNFCRVFLNQLCYPPCSLKVCGFCHFVYLMFITMIVFVNFHRSRHRTF